MLISFLFQSIQRQLFPLEKWHQNVYSQYGEDGVIAYLIKQLPTQNKWAVEFWANDGIYYSNTYRLIVEENYQAVYIEGALIPYMQLLETQKKHPTAITAIHSYITHQSEQTPATNTSPPSKTIDALLKNTPVPPDVDIMSIDIDSYEYHVWQSMKQYHPKIVIIEYNVWMLPHVWHLHDQPLPHRSKYIKPYVGNSLATILSIGKAKGYVPVHMTLSNVLFVRQDLMGTLKPIQHFTLCWMTTLKLPTKIIKAYVWHGCYRLRRWLTHWSKR